MCVKFRMMSVVSRTTTNRGRRTDATAVFGAERIEVMTRWYGLGKLSVAVRSSSSG
jgi:hypothetical protein